MTPGKEVEGSLLCRGVNLFDRDDWEVYARVGVGVKNYIIAVCGGVLSVLPEELIYCGLVKGTKILGGSLISGRSCGPGTVCEDQIGDKSPAESQIDELVWWIDELDEAGVSQKLPSWVVEPDRCSPGNKWKSKDKRV